MADQLGNLLSRLVGMVNRYYDGIVPAPGTLEDSDCCLVGLAQELPQRLDAAIARFAPHEALSAIWDVIGTANKYIVDVRPWELAKQRQENVAAETRLRTTLYNLAEVLRSVAYYCAPFLPITAKEICYQLGISYNAKSDQTQVSNWGGYPPNTTIQPNGVLFPKIEIPLEDIVN